MTVSKSHFPHSFHPRKFSLNNAFYLYFYLYIFQFIDLQYLQIFYNTQYNYPHADAGLTLWLTLKMPMTFKFFLGTPAFVSNTQKLRTCNQSP
jgi:hypothetical protein